MMQEGTGLSDKLVGEQNSALVVLGLPAACDNYQPNLMFPPRGHPAVHCPLCCGQGGKLPPGEGRVGHTPQLQPSSTRV